jgi:hypothetical protein
MCLQCGFCFGESVRAHRCFEFRFASSYVVAIFLTDPASHLTLYPGQLIIPFITSPIPFSLSSTLLMVRLQKRAISIPEINSLTHTLILY